MNRLKNIINSRKMTNRWRQKWLLNSGAARSISSQGRAKRDKKSKNSDNSRRRKFKPSRRLKGSRAATSSLLYGLITRAQNQLTTGQLKQV